MKIDTWAVIFTFLLLVFAFLVWTWTISVPPWWSFLVFNDNIWSSGWDLENTKDDENNAREERNLAITWELRVSPYGTEKNVLDRFAQTKYSLDIWLYRLTYHETETLFKNLADLWVQIRRIAENKPYEWVDKKFLQLKKRLEKHDIYVVNDEHLWTNFNHAKAFVSDSDRFLISTANLTYTSLSKNREYRFSWTHPDVVRSLKKVFEKDLKWKMIEERDIFPWLLVCPINCRYEIEDLILGAEHSIIIQAQYIQDDRLIDLLIRRQKNLDLSIIVWKWQNAWWLDDFDTWVVKIVSSPYIHAKNMLIDGKSFLIWSMNFSTNALDNNREIGIVTKDVRAIKTFKRQFEKDRESWILLKDWNFEKDWF